MHEKGRNGMTAEELLEHEGEHREAIMNVMKETYLSHDPEVVQKSIDLHAKAHDYLHLQMSHLGMEGMKALLSEDKEEMLMVAQSVQMLTAIHFAVEHFELILVDHQRRLEAGELQKPSDD